MLALRDAVQYLIRATQLARSRALRPWVIMPLVFNVVLFGVLYGLAGHWISGWIEAAAAGWEAGWAWLNTIIEALVAAARVLVWVILLAVFASIFTMGVQLIAAPFMGILAEKVDVQLSGVSMPAETLPAMIVRMFRREARKTWYWLWRALLLLIAVAIVSLIPGINVLAPVIWFAWSGWMMAMQYLDFSADNRQVSFAGMLAEMQQRRWLVLAFGCLVLALTMLPLVNLLIMPVAVIAGTLMRTEQLAPRAP